MLESWPKFLIVLAKESYFYASCPLFFPQGKRVVKRHHFVQSGIWQVRLPNTGRTQTYLWEATFFGANSYSSGYQRLHTAKMELSKANVSGTLNNFVSSLLTKKALGLWLLSLLFAWDSIFHPLLSSFLNILFGQAHQCVRFLNLLTPAQLSPEVLSWIPTWLLDTTPKNPSDTSNYTIQNHTPILLTTSLPQSTNLLFLLLSFLFIFEQFHHQPNCPTWKH